jgi:hypothetical protein
VRRTGTPQDLVNRPGPLAIILALLHRGPLTRQELEDIVGVQSGTIRYHVYAMADAGILAASGEPPQRLHLVDARPIERMLDKARPGWREGGIPQGALWREVQAAIDTRRKRGTYRTRIRTL